MSVPGPDVGVPPLEITARNTAADSDNKIHDDAEARRYGYAGGLVPGVTLYAYLTQLAVGVFGPTWLEQGTADVSFRRPVYQGETVRCEGTVTGGAEGSAALELRVLRDGVVCAGGSAGLGSSGAVPAVGVGQAPGEPLPELRPDSVPVGRPLAPLHGHITEEGAGAYADATSDPNPWYRGPSPFGGPLVPPGWLAARQAPLLRHNFRFGPSIHVRSVVRHVAPGLAGRSYETRGVIRATYERGGNHYLILDAETRDEQGRSVCLVEHHTIFAVRQV